MLGSLSEHSFIVAQFDEDGLRFGTDGGRSLRQEVDQCANGEKAFRGLKPLWLWQTAGPGRITLALLQHQRHRVLIGGKEFEKGAHLQSLSQALQSIFVTGQCPAIHKDVEAWVFSFNDDVQTRSHQDESSRDNSVRGGKVCCGNPMNHRDDSKRSITLDYQKNRKYYKRVIPIPVKATILFIDSLFKIEVGAMDWSKLPDLGAVTLLACAFASVARRSPMPVSRLWLTGWVMIVLHFAASVFRPVPGLWGTVADIIGLAALTWSGLLFMWASVPYRKERSRPWILTLLLATNTLYIGLIIVNPAATWPLDLAADLFVAAPLLLMVLALPQLNHPLHWATVLLYSALSIFLLVFQHRPGNGADLALNAVMFTVFIGCFIHFLYTYRGATTGAFITIAGFFAWASVFVVDPMLSAFLPNLRLESEMSNLPIFVVAVGMILLVLENQIEHNKYLALHDALTGLPNRRLFQDRLASALERARRSGTHAALLLIDLDRFKQVNDTLGHHVGDLLLVRVGEIFSGRVRRSDTVARTGGDEFSIILEEPTSRKDAECVGQSLAQCLKEPLELGDHRVRIGASVGIAVFPEDALAMEPLCIAADLRMYAEKHGSRGRRLGEQTAIVMPESLPSVKAPTDLQ
jgi:diguanylate cyclase (GGDEF)-like protein